MLLIKLLKIKNPKELKNYLLKVLKLWWENRKNLFKNKKILKFYPKYNIMNNINQI